jgi:hypothetical protein
MKKNQIFITMLFVLTSCSSINPGTNDHSRVLKDLAVYDKTIQEMRDKFNKGPSNINDKAWVKLKIDHMVEMDQFMRKFTGTPHKNGYTEEEQKYFQEKFMPKFSLLDKENTAEMKKLLSVHDWFKISDFGERTDKRAWLLVQHADLDLSFQKEVLAVLTKLYQKGETNKSNYAYLYDRVKAIGEKTPQRYGTQGQCVGPGKWEPHEIEDSKNVDNRRKKMGMVSMKEYKSWFKNICK